MIPPFPGAQYMRLSGHGTEALSSIINPAANERAALGCVGLACTGGALLRFEGVRKGALAHALQPWDPKAERRPASIGAGGKRSLTRRGGQWFARCRRTNWPFAIPISCRVDLSVFFWPCEESGMISAVWSLHSFDPTTLPAFPFIVCTSTHSLP
jgi:hypothetical protein